MDVSEVVVPVAESPKQTTTVPVSKSPKHITAVPVAESSMDDSEVVFFVVLWLNL